MKTSEQQWCNIIDDVIINGIIINDVTINDVIININNDDVIDQKVDDSN